MARLTFYALISIVTLIPTLSLGNEIPTRVEKSELKTYIVHVKKADSRMTTQFDDTESYHKSFLPITTSDSSDENRRLLYSYKNVISGFSARLTAEEVETMKLKDGFISVQQERILHTLTTHSPNFLGLHKELGFWNQSNFGKGIIIGVLDTGIFPSHPSFSDDNLPPPPAKWKGKCDFKATECNNKLIGARSFNLAANASKLNDEPPYDDDGHGTHTASTAAGGFVENASVLGNAYGTAVGMAPQAHLAIYKVCFGPDCPDSDILAGLDAAVEDGVDILSISLGGDEPLPFFQDNIAIGSFAATEKGILVSCAAGNSGPFGQTLSNEAPWILTVGASTLDRSIRAIAKLGDGQEFDGESVFQPKNFPPTLLPLVYPGSNGKQESSLCANGSLADLNVKGKIVVCDRGGGIARIAKGQEVKDAGGAAMILVNLKPDGFSTLADAHVLPATHVAYNFGLKIKAYINSTTTPMATLLFKGTVIGDPLAPMVSSFSSRGPNLASPGILKPDIIGPGANDPGLIYDIAPRDYIPYLCGLGYTEEQVGILARRVVDCREKIVEGELNYPTFSVSLGSSETFTRTVTNVGEAASYYSVKIVAPDGVSVSVNPEKLHFTKVNQKETYNVTFSRKGNVTSSFSQGYLLWVSRKHAVRSMGLKSFLTLICILNFHSLQAFADDTPNESNLETYIVQVEVPDEQLTTHSKHLESRYKSFLPTITSSDRMIYSYHTVLKGFAARLSPIEVKAMENMDGFISARPARKLPLHTTHTPNFMGLNQNTGFWQDSNYGKGVIIGVLDGGIFPNHPSFSDEGMPPPPAKWKGRCDFNGTSCNNKLIGARDFVIPNGIPSDDDGHGTHTASTAAGNFVKDANVFGNANGTASGIAPLAHLAIYRVCSFFCFDSDILAAMDAAIDDGVDILSISIGGVEFNFYDDAMALGAFSAMEKGILVSTSAGNSGPSSFSLSNEAPWMLTVGASTIDRKIRATAILGNNEQFDGESLFQPMDFSNTLLPLVYAGMLNTSDPDLRFCRSSSLNMTDVRGKIVVCELGGFITRIAKGRAVKNAGGVGMILINGEAFGNLTLSEAHVLPATHVTYADGLKIKAYINSTATPMATISFKGTIIGDNRAPVVAAFSSRGPNWASRGHVNPSRANDPGLVYDIQSKDYIPYLCGLNYTNRQVGLFLQRRVNCSEESSIPEAQLNYPSFALTFRTLQSTVQTYTRTVTNVGEPNSSYVVEIVPPPGIDVSVEPAKLDFVELKQTLQYKVTFSRLVSATNIGFVQGFLRWSSSKHSVRSPIAVIL
ncbi:hypothetical protein ACJIZ3_008306 [Penstemon smallii]|uniref:Uncharacterized protein n=1 Tax=Penstemon smallii TaxID=265156 RepID=A0ABD3T9C5_9LAMI